MTELSSVTGPPAGPVPEQVPRRSVPWLVMAATVVVGAGVQAATAAPGLGNASSGAFLVAALASLVAAVVEAALLAWAAHAVVHRSRLGGLPLGLVVWSLVVVLVLAAVSVLVAPAVLLVLVAALCVLPAAAAGERNALRGFRVFRRTPLRTVLAALAVVLLGVVSWLVAVVAGFFLTGALGGAVMWLWFGTLSALVLVWWTHKAGRAQAAPVEPSPDPVPAP
jgi:hypothetical protein